MEPGERVNSEKEGGEMDTKKAQEIVIDIEIASCQISLHLSEIEKMLISINAGSQLLKNMLKKERDPL